MDTTERRMKLARQLTRLAGMIREADTGRDFDLALDELHLIGRDANGYHRRTVDAMYEEEYAPAIEAVTIRKVCRKCGVHIHPMAQACEAHK